MITTFGYFELYATYIGWFFYQEIVVFIVDSGLFLIVPILMYFKTYSDAKTGQHTKSGAGSAVNQMGIESLKTAAFLMFFFLPMVTLNPSNINFEIEDGTVVNIDNNESTFNNNFNISDFDNVRIPLGWAALLKITGGINTALLHIFPDVKNLREELMYVNTINLKDEHLKAEVKRFHQECYTKAYSYYKKNQIEADPEDDDVIWAGSQTMLNAYGSWNVCQSDCNPVFRADNPVRGFSVDPRVDVDPIYDQGGETVGTPLCSVWWPTLKEKVYDEVSQDQLSELEYISSMMGASEEERKDFLVREAFTDTESLDLSSPGAKYADKGRAFDGWFAALYSGASIQYEKVISQGAVYGIVRSLPILQGLFLLVLYFSLPILQLIGRLTFRSCVMLIIGFIALRLLTVWWHLAYWLDEFFIGSIITSGASDNGVFNSISGGGLDRVYMSFILLTAYILIPFTFSVYLGWVGYKASANVGTPALAVGAAHKAMESKVK